MHFAPCPLMRVTKMSPFAFATGVAPASLMVDSSIVGSTLSQKKCIVDFMNVLCRNVVAQQLRRADTTELLLLNQAEAGILFAHLPGSHRAERIDRYTTADSK